MNQLIKNQLIPPETSTAKCDFIARIKLRISLWLKVVLLCYSKHLSQYDNPVHTQTVSYS